MNNNYLVWKEKKQELSRKIVQVQQENEELQKNLDNKQQSLQKDH